MLPLGTAGIWANAQLAAAHTIKQIHNARQLRTRQPPESQDVSVGCDHIFQVARDSACRAISPKMATALKRTDDKIPMPRICDQSAFASLVRLLLLRRRS